MLFNRSKTKPLVTKGVIPLDLPILISLLLNAIGVTLSVSGAISNALGKYRLAFTLWIASNGMLLVLFVGVALDWWILNNGVWFQVLLYTIFCVTSTAGYWRESKTPSK